MNNSTKSTELQPAIDFILPDGADWDEENLEWFIRVDGEKAGWGYLSQQAAWDAYSEELRVSADHQRRSIPVFANGGKLTGILEYNPQLSQLQRKAPDLYNLAIQGTITSQEGTQRLLTRLTDPKETLWLAVKAKVESGTLSLRSGSQVEVGELNGKKISLVTGRGGHIRLYAGGIDSAPVGLHGRDWANLSSAFSGMWKLTDYARQSFDVWYEKLASPPAPSKVWKKRNGQWI